IWVNAIFDIAGMTPIFSKWEWLAISQLPRDFVSNFLLPITLNSSVAASSLAQPKPAVGSFEHVIEETDLDGYANSSLYALSYVPSLPSVDRQRSLVVDCHAAP